MTLQFLRDNAGNRKPLPGAPTSSVLTDVMIHGQDIGQPPSIEQDFPEDHRGAGHSGRKVALADLADSV